LSPIRNNGLAVNRSNPGDDAVARILGVLDLADFMRAILIEQHKLPQAIRAAFDQALETEGLSYRGLSAILGRTPKFAERAVNKGISLKIGTLCELARALGYHVVFRLEKIPNNGVQ